MRPDSSQTPPMAVGATYSAAFSAALLEPDRETPALVTGQSGRAVTKRYNVYRNNVTVSLIDALAAASPAEKACSAQWADLKKANKVPEGQTWPKFWSECSKDFAAKNPTETPAAAAKPEKAPAPEKAAKEPKETKKTAAVDNDTPNANQQKHDCDAKWDEHKTSSGAHGWHDYFKFMAGCM